VVVVPKGHPLVDIQNVTLEHVADYPIITYERDITGRAHIDEAFEKCGRAPDVVLTAIDADVIKTYVELGMGVGVVAGMAYDPKRDSELVALDSQHLFKESTTRVGLRKGAILRSYAYRFIEMIAPQLAGTDITERLREAA
jgi:LysR family cys regulon transcriptional activator